MDIILVSLVLFLISFLLALRSMRDFRLPAELQHMLNARKVKGTIVFLRNKIVHYK